MNYSNNSNQKQQHYHQSHNNHINANVINDLEFDSEGELPTKSHLVEIPIEEIK